MSEQPLYDEDYLRQVADFQKNVLSKLPKNGTTRTPLPDTKQKEEAAAPQGSFHTGVYIPPDVGRAAYIEAVQNEARAEEYASYLALPDRRLHFLDRVDSLNYFHPHFVYVFRSFLKRYGEGTLVVTRGLSPLTGKPNPHTIGMAVDIQVESKEERNRVMNAAWLAGIPTIVQAGSTATGAHVHLDICPYEPFLYDGKIYEGPWSL